MKLGRRITIAIIGFSVVSAGSLWLLGARTFSYEVNATMKASREKIFPFLIDPNLQPRWIGGLVKSKPLTTGPIRSGSRSNEILRKGNRQIETSTIVRRIEAPGYLETEIHSDYWIARSIFEVTPGTNIRHRMFVTYQGFWMRVLAPLMKSTVQKKLQDDLMRLETMVTALPQSTLQQRQSHRA